MILIALMAAQLATVPTLTGSWVGPLELTVQAPRPVRGEIPTDVELIQTGDRITGTWRSRPPNTQSGTISGTLTKVEVVFYADADTAPERCQATVTFTARLTASNIYRLTAGKMRADTRAGKDCGPWPTELVWRLQRQH